jgi:hypothetical protein
LSVFAEQTGTVQERAQQTAHILLEGGLLQRARSSRKTIVQRIQGRLTNWDPPLWVMEELVEFAKQGPTMDLQAALLLHVCRQDTLLYALVQEVIFPQWQMSQVGIGSVDVQNFLDRSLPQHPEIESWSYQTRDRIGTMTLTLLRDYGLLQGKARKRIVQPIVSDRVVYHLVKLLAAEGIHEEEVPFHPDWQLWLWKPEQVTPRLKVLVPA